MGVTVSISGIKGSPAMLILLSLFSDGSRDRRSIVFHAFHTPSFPGPVLGARFTKSQSPRRPVLRTGTTCPRWRRPHAHFSPSGGNRTITEEILSVPIGISVPCDLTPKQPIDNAEIEKCEHSSENPPGQADAEGVRTGERASYCDTLATRICRGQ